MLTFSHIAVQPEFVVGLCAGWQCFIDNLGAHLAAEPFVDRFDELQQAYQKELAAQVF